MGTLNSPLPSLQLRTESIALLRLWDWESKPRMKMAAQLQFSAPVAAIGAKQHCDRDYLFSTSIEYSRLCSSQAGPLLSPVFLKSTSARSTAVHASEATADVVTADRKKRGSGPVLVVDNYDSFTYNLCQYLGDLGCDYVVFRNDDVTIEDVERMDPRGVLISPGPGTPDDSGISLDVVRRLGPRVPLFGVCMGLQCMGQAFGGKIVRAPHGVMHGKTSPVFHSQAHDTLGLLAGLPSPFTACRYHSLVIDKETFPEDELEITAWTEDGLIMAIRHKRYKHIEGVQFHPESIMTKNGNAIVANFLKGLDAFWNSEAVVST